MSDKGLSIFEQEAPKIKENFLEPLEKNEKLQQRFHDENVNKNGATLIYSTHYSELLDEYERNDCIYIVRNRGGIYAENLSLILKRNDIKKSEAYESGYLEGTVPVYEAYMALKKVLSSVKIEEDEEEND